MKALKTLLLPMAVLVIAPTVSFAQNNTAATAANVVVGMAGIETNTDATNTQRWYKTRLQAGRSYCAEVSPTVFNPTNLDTDLTIAVFQSNGTTLIVSNDDYQAEPGYSSAFGPSRACWVSSATVADQDIRIRTQNFSGTGIPYRFRIVDTSLNCPFWFSDLSSNFDGFLQIRNNSNSTAVLATITVYSSTGAQLGTPATVVLPANDNAAFAVSGPPFNAPAGSGSIAVSYGRDTAAAACPAGTGGALCASGAPGTVSANLTSLSFSAGVGFDVPCTMRQDFRY